MPGALVPGGAAPYLHPMRKPLQVTPGGVAASVLVLAVAAVCVRLGVWQLGRHEERRARSEAIAERIEQPPAALSSLPGDTAGLLYRRVRIHGVYDPARAVVLPGRSHRGAPGVHLLTPLRLDGGPAALVNRGWLPSADAATVDLSPFDTAGAVTLEGIIVPLPGGAGPAETPPEPQPFPLTWFYMDLRGLPERFPYPVAPYLVQALPDGGAGYPVRLPPPEAGSGPHLSYAVQWFSFGLIGVVGWLIIVAKGGVGRARGRKEVAE